MQAQRATSEVPLIDVIGGRDVVLRVHRVFYGKVYAHPWLKGFFANSDRQHQENQLTDFFVGILGGPLTYSGRLPNKAHPHLFITDEVFDIRHGLLAEALAEVRIDPDIAAIWLERDELFRKVIVKKSVSECHGRYKTEAVIAPAKP
ncbi:hypothetical protein BN1012_Phect3097 [Candidatus Phaeomarinobacter ectocarpi]|uniref:Group 1 truncated hemoglobin n=1 Tax=Candidatus Phaeomarinibacter ectocarpi TaxID=1458461 RepID=X5MHN7_9HYPH|nr:group 1 truncated hemoglobin [Candidatus Phaeomarinobacter ectocarpi]CDO61309.1 hypothetical protein BN1012_Phect3097 [Candidatus Phaeomarinobacter ectocarpi]